MDWDPWFSKHCTNYVASPTKKPGTHKEPALKLNGAETGFALISCPSSKPHLCPVKQPASRGRSGRGGRIDSLGTVLIPPQLFPFFRYTIQIMPGPF